MKQVFYFLIISVLIFGCKSNSKSNHEIQDNPTFVKGADVGWLPQMEATGFKFYDADGSQKNCLQLLKDRGINTVRLRVWVNPSDDKTSGHCSKKETVEMAKRAKQMNMRVMIDFHYSDSWADPQKQNKPAQWANHSVAQLGQDMYQHTYDVLDTLKKEGLTPEWVQIGNEISNGMLWPEGEMWKSYSNFSNLALFLNKGYDAAKAVDNSIKVIIQLDRGNEIPLYKCFFDSCAKYNVNYDIVGMSFYPFWLNKDYTQLLDDLKTNMQNVISRYNKPVFIVEVGGDYTKEQNTYDMLKAVINNVKYLPNNMGIGVIYWEPEGAKVWSGYQLSCWRDDGKPSMALDAFKN